LAVKKVFSYIREFREKEFSWSFFIPLALFLGVSFFLNYEYSFKKSHIQYFSADFTRYFKIFAFLGVPVLGSFLLYAVFHGAGEKRHLLRKPRIWLFLLFTVVSYGISVGWHPFMEGIVQGNMFGQSLGTRNFVKSSYIFAMRGTLMIAIPFLWWVWNDRKQAQSPAYYGFRYEKGHGRFYGTLVFVVLGITFLASLRESFTDFYPMFKPSKSLVKDGISLEQARVIWEAFYLAHFVAVEFFFRGFLVMALARMMGPGAIWVMASMYMFIHFSKPPGEALSSFFGGMLLGILALRTRSILGGVLLHVTMALSMDIFALMSK
jgi:hypothetical protein